MNKPVATIQASKENYEITYAFLVCRGKTVLFTPRSDRPDLGGSVGGGGAVTGDVTDFTTVL
jgi:hypothetical protein